MPIGNKKALQMNAKFTPSDSPSSAMNKLNMSCVGGGRLYGEQTGAPPTLVVRMTDTHDFEHYLAVTSMVGGKYM